MAKKQFLKKAQPVDVNQVITPEQAAKALANWIKTMKQGDPKKVGALYDKDASFWGTMADDLATTPDDTEAYFVGFLGGKNNLDIKIDSNYTQSEGQICMVSGNYTFSFDDDNGQACAVAARYSFTFKKKDNGQIYIINHHSSQLPGNQPSLKHN